MSQRTELTACRISGMEWERDALTASIELMQAKHKPVAGLQARLKEVTNDILRLEVGHG